MKKNKGFSMVELMIAIAIIAILAGAIADIAWLVLFTGTVGTPVITNTGVYEIVPGFVVGAIVAIAVTLMTKAPGAEVEAIYNAATDTSVDD